MIKDRPGRLSLLYISQPIFFVTFCTRDRRLLPSLPDAQAALEAYGKQGRKRFAISVGRYVIMPNHIHLFVSGRQDFDLSRWVGGLKRKISVAANLTGQLWQPGFFDHVLRTDESYSAKWGYVAENPVRAGLVADAERWPYQGDLGALDWGAADTAAATGA